MGSLNEIHVILAEDNKDALSALERLLSRSLNNKFSASFIIHPCEDGAKALGIFNELVAQGRTPKMIITDRNMPNMDGFEFLESDAVKAQKGISKIMYSGMEISEKDKEFNQAIEHAIADGVSFFRKPDQLPEFKSAVLEEAARFAEARQPEQRPAAFVELIRRDLGVSLGLTPRLS